MSTLMTPEHPLWEDFIERLSGPEGCNFKDDLTWQCDGGRSRPRAVRILLSMDDIDVEGSLAYFDRHGGYCDCEIIFNVDPSSRRSADDIDGDEGLSDFTPREPISTMIMTYVEPDQVKCEEGEHKTRQYQVTPRSRQDWTILADVCYICETIMPVLPNQLTLEQVDWVMRWNRRIPDAH